MKNQTKITGQEQLLKDVKKLLLIFKSSDAKIRPHFILTGPSGSGKSFTIASLCEALEIRYEEINAAQLTKEGTSGNSLSKAMASLGNTGGLPTVCFVDEFDKLFISGNSNSELAHETTNGVQNEFLKVLESNHASIYGDYGKYMNISINNVLFVFAGAFNGEESIDLDRLRDFGVKTEFLGRVGLVFNTQPLSLDDIMKIFDESILFKNYISLIEDVDPEQAAFDIKAKIKQNYENNTLGARMINNLIHQYFIKEGFENEEDKKVTFQNKLSFKSEE